MDLFLSEDKPSSVNIPKLTITSFEVKNNYYVVTDGTNFNYFAIKVLPSEDSSPLIRFEKSPPVLLEGVAIVNNKVYRVSLQDLLRRIIRKSREIIYEVNNERTSSSQRNRSTNSNESTTDTSIEHTREGVQSEEQQGTRREAQLEVGEAANFAWEEQIGALLHTLSEKEGEEWEITEAT